MSGKSAAIQIVKAVLFCGFICAVCYLIRPAEFGVLDLSQYWSASYLALDGLNPYNHRLIVSVESKFFDHGESIFLWNPPIVFAFIWPLALLPPKLASAIWMGLALCVTLASIVILSRCFKLYPPLRSTIGRLTTIVALTSYSLILALWFGQISFLLLGSFSLYLYFRFRPEQNENTTFLAGLSLSVTLIKPHLLYLIYLLELLRGPTQSRIKFFSGLLSGLLIMTAIPLLIESRLFEWYMLAAQNPPIYWQTPTIGSFLQGISGVHSIYTRFLPTLVVGVLFALYQFFKKGELSLEEILVWLPISFITSPYGWPYDQMVLISCVIWIGATLKQKAAPMKTVRAILLIILAAQLMMAVFTSGEGLQLLFWYPILLFVLLLYVKDFSPSSAN